jgi:deazaflavin-dependent oxidoreductase (nitroreductase family)
MPSDLVLKGMNAVHRLVLRATGGRLGHAAAGMPVLELTTTGRRSGAARSVLLTSPLRDGEAYVVVASRGGDDRHPDWYLNLRADPAVRVAVQGAPPAPMRAVIAGPEQRARLWPAVVGKFPHYGGYQRRTSREIPLVLLTPAD